MIQIGGKMGGETRNYILSLRTRIPGSSTSDIFKEPRPSHHG